VRELRLAANREAGKVEEENSEQSS